MLVAKTRRDVEQAVKASEEQSHPIHVTNAAGTHTVAIRVHALTVHFGQNVWPEWITPKWYGLDRTDKAMLDDITDWLLESEVAGNNYPGQRKTRTLFGRQFAARIRATD